MPSSQRQTLSLDVDGNDEDLTTCISIDVDSTNLKKSFSSNSDSTDNRRRGSLDPSSPLTPVSQSTSGGATTGRTRCRLVFLITTFILLLVHLIGPYGFLNIFSNSYRSDSSRLGRTAPIGISSNVKKAQAQMKKEELFSTDPAFMESIKGYEEDEDESYYGKLKVEKWTTQPRYEGARNFSDKSVEITDDTLPFPAYGFIENKTVVPNLKPSSAAAALECRDSVKAFVINATDVNDECEGLRNAFDKTCSSGGPGEVTNLNVAAAVAAAQAAESNKRRRLFVNESQSQGELAGAKVSWEVRTVRFFRWLYRSCIKMNLDLLCETEECNREKMDLVSFPVNSRHIFLTNSYKRHERRLGDGGDEIEDEYYEMERDKAKSDDLKKPLSPSIPTSKEHIGEQMLNDAVTLSEGASNEAISNAIKAVVNRTGYEDTLSFAGTDAEVSATAISAATEAVSSILNNPDSIEARKCCASILDVFHENCDNPGDAEITDRRLFVIVSVIAVCGMVKSLIRHFQIRWLPEAAGCILVGVVGGLGLQFVPHFDFGFQHDMFLRVMVPPIVFEAAINIDKRAFSRHVVPIVTFAVFGTLISTLLTAFIVFKGTSLLGSLCASIPFVESLAFGALISSIDPIAVLSVMSNMGMSHTDTIYVLIFGESLLNDGVAIVLFETLVHFLDEKLVIDNEAIWAAALHFLAVAGGSLSIGFLSGAFATVYFWAMHGIQTPLVEVLMFLCWAFIPYYICDGVEWSGIVAIVATGFVMDVYVIGHRLDPDHVVDDVSSAGSNGDAGLFEESHLWQNRLYCRVFSREGFLSSKAKSHIGFVTEINSTLMETAIFAYLGLFLFSSRYHWNFWISATAIFACTLSRAIMIPALSLIANCVGKMSSPLPRRQAQNNIWSKINFRFMASLPERPKEGAFVDPKMQIVLVFAGLRGAMSFALVETIPMYDTVTGEGSRLKPELKAMTSASIVFTVFVLGGYTYYLMKHLGMTLEKENDDVVNETESPTKGPRQRNGDNVNRIKYRGVGKRE